MSLEPRMSPPREFRDFKHGTATVEHAATLTTSTLAALDRRTASPSRARPRPLAAVLVGVEDGDERDPKGEAEPEEEVALLGGRGAG